MRDVSVMRCPLCSRLWQLLLTSGCPCAGFSFTIYMKYKLYKLSLNRVQWRLLTIIQTPLSWRPSSVTQQHIRSLFTPHHRVDFHMFACLQQAGFCSQRPKVAQPRKHISAQAFPSFANTFMSASKLIHNPLAQGVAHPASSSYCTPH